MPAITNLDDIKDALMLRFNLSPWQLLEIYRAAIGDRMGRIK